MPLVVSGALTADWPGIVPIAIDPDDPQRRRSSWRAARHWGVRGGAGRLRGALFAFPRNRSGGCATRAHDAAHRRAGPAALATDDDVFDAARATARYAARRPGPPRDRRSGLGRVGAPAGPARAAGRVGRRGPAGAPGPRGVGLRGLAPSGGTAASSPATGTGKTMAAGLIAGRLGLDLYVIDLSAIVSKYIGDTEKNLARVFDAAEASGAVLLFDEATRCSAAGRPSATRTTATPTWRSATCSSGSRPTADSRYRHEPASEHGSRLHAANAVRGRLPRPGRVESPPHLGVHVPPARRRAEGLDSGVLASRFDVAGATIRDAA